MKYRVRRIEERAWSVLTSLDLEELLVLSLCLLEKLIAGPFPMDIMAPVCPWQLAVVVDSMGSIDPPLYGCEVVS
jgi:hypothetical protein